MNSIRTEEETYSPKGLTMMKPALWIGSLSISLPLNPEIQIGKLKGLKLLTTEIVSARRFLFYTLSRTTQG